MVKNPPTKKETWVQSLGWEDPLEKNTATLSSVLCLENPMDREAWWATVQGVTRVGHDLVTKPPSPPLLPSRGPVPGACSYSVIYIYINMRMEIGRLARVRSVKDVSTQLR